MIVGISGKANSGKDTAADYLVSQYKFTKIALADPIKRFLMEIFDFTEEQLWGSSENREIPDKRYISKLTEEYCTYLTPRFALQKIGTEGARTCYENVWIDYAIRICDKLQSGKYDYDRKIGVYPSFDNKKKDVVVSDIRFKNELARIKEQGVVLRIKRFDESFISDNHVSETQQKEIDDKEFDMVIYNDTTLSILHENIKLFMTDIDYKNRFDK
jgi:hypothetical protein